jgi:hypothetical protein
MLTTQQGCETSVYGAVMPFDEIKSILSESTPNCGTQGYNWCIHPYIPYLIPYYMPMKLLLFEVCGPYAGAKCGHISLPSNADQLSTDLWQFSEDICKAKLDDIGIKLSFEI